MTEQRRSEVGTGGHPVLARLAGLIAFVATAAVLFLVLFTQAPASAGPQSSAAGGSSGSPEVSGARPQDAAAGESVYAANCASCHQPAGTGVPGTFPPLAGNPNVADPAYVEQVIREGVSGPIEVNGETYDSNMPAITGLSDTEIADATAYVTSLAEGGAAEPAEPVEEVPDEGTVAGGEDLFRGTTSLANGGTACVGCHTAGSIGNLGGPGLGPDLTNSAGNLGGKAGLSAWLVNPPSPTMMPIFAEHPLTPDEIADLTAFLVDAPEQSRPSDAVDWMLLAAVAGVLVAIAAMAFTYRGMRQTYRERISARSDRRTS